ncbi:MAG: hypothetical protein VKK98_02290 [Cyanobacteriota bacterium]|nr:hypothetical protein [Cyanobacteriota bacterium]
MPSFKLWNLLGSWLLAFALSAALVAAGERWPAPLPIRPALVWTLVLLPPLLVAAVLLWRWRQAADGGPAGDGGESGGRVEQMR